MNILINFLSSNVVYACVKPTPLEAAAAPSFFERGGNFLQNGISNL